MLSRSCLIVLLFGCLTSRAHTLETHADLLGSIEQSSNGNHTNIGGGSEFGQSAGAVITVFEDIWNWDVNAQYIAKANRYSRGTSRDKNLVFGSSNLKWTPLPDRFSWFVSHQIEESRTDARQEDIPDNRETRNVVTTGPSLIVSISPVDSLVTTVTYTDVHFEESNVNDSERVAGQLSWSHQTSATRSFGAGMQYTDVQFDNEARDIENHSAFLTFTSALHNGQYGLQLGGNRIKRSTGDENDGLYLRFDYNNIIGGNPVSFIIVNQLTDSSLGFGENTLPGVDSQLVDTNFDVVDVVEQTRVALNYSALQICRDCKLLAELSYNSLDYETEPRDQHAVGLNSSFRFAYNSRWGVIGGLNYQYIEYEGIDDRKDSNSAVSLGLDYRFSERFVVSLLATHQRRDSNIDVRDFEDNGGVVSVTYPLW